MKDLTRLYFLVSGRVQGVGFRWFVLQEARSLGLTGWARNLEDGAVELEAEGSPQALERLRQALAEGPSAAKVEKVESREVPVRGSKTFEIR